MVMPSTLEPIGGIGFAWVIAIVGTLII